MDDLNRKIDRYDKEIEDLKTKTQNEIQAQEALQAKRLQQELDDRENKRLRENIEKTKEDSKFEMEKLLNEEKEKARKIAEKAAAEVEATRQNLKS